MRYRHTRRRRRASTVFILLLAVVICGEIAVLSSMLRSEAADTSGIASVFSFLRREKEPEDWRLILVNAAHTLPDGYEIEFTELRGGVRVDSRIYPDLQTMFDDARSQGVNPIVGEGYRSHDEQERMMQLYIDRYTDQGYSDAEAREMAEQYVAQPGTSEHELGIAVDINGGEGSSDQEVYDWLAENAWKYGFILRYPSGKEDITGIDYEPWHYRYVGHEVAKEIYDEQLTLEEYLDK